MRRKIDKVLDTWANEANPHPVIIRGARRVGKTYAVKRLGAERFPGSFAYCDFQTNLSQLNRIFEGTTDVERIAEDLSLFLGMDVRKGETLIAFDEVQLCEKALNSLRFFSESGYRVVATGSQLGMTLRDRTLPFPSDVEHLYLRPLDFEEYLWACGEGRLAKGIRRAFDERCEFSFHDEALSQFRRYVVTGGMPRVVADCVAHGDMESVRTLQAEIIETYTADIALYAPSDEAVRVRSVWDSLPQQLARESTRKFKYADVQSGGRERVLRAPLAWLEMAELVMLNRQTNEMSAPLVARDGGSFFKVYLLDVGLLYHRLNLDARAFLDDGLRRALSPRFRGAIAENYVMQALCANGIETYYWTPGTTSASEVEFVVQNRLGQIVPIEVKSGSNVRSRSLTAFQEKSGAPIAVRVSEKNFGLSAGVMSVPLYAAFCFDEAALMALAG